jgi:O-antigen ligase
VASGVRTGAAAVLLAAPTLLAFFSGGYFAEPRLWAALLVWAALAVLALVVPARLPRSRAALACLGGLAGLTLWVALSIAWAPLRDPALGDAERLVLYLGFALCAVLALRGWAALRAVEPALAAGAFVVSGYALATRLVPGIVPSHHGVRAEARLDQPLTYWNGLGAVAAIGLVLALRLTSDPSRDPRLRAAAIATTPAFALVLSLTLSRGSLVAAGAGVALLLVLARDRATVRSAALALGAGVLLAALAAGFPAVDSLDGGKGDLESQGAVVLALLVGTGALLAAVQHWLSARAGAPRRALAAAGAAAICLAVVGVVAAPSSGGKERAATGDSRSGDVVARDRSRLRSLKSNRVKYWKVALGDGFAAAPLWGTGSRGFSTIWLEHRDITESVTDAHSLYIETLAELGLVGALLLAAFLGGAVAAAVRVYRSGPRGRLLATGWLAAGGAFLVHAALDWDWEMPAVALIFLVLVAAGLAAAEEPVSAPAD